jgi:PAS domain S-box-containing protein
MDAAGGTRGAGEPGAPQDARPELELESGRALTAVLDALADAVTIRAPDDRVVYANRAALERMSIESVEQLAGADPRALMDPYETVDEHGRPIRMEDLPSVRLLRGERPEPLLLRTVSRAGGDEHWVVLKATAITAPDGRVEAAVTIIEDVTAAKRAELRSAFLLRAGRVLASSLDYEQTLRNVANLAVPHIADWCAVDLFDADGDRKPVAVAHVDPAKLAMAARLREYEPEELDPERGLGRVLRTGEPELYPEIPEELIREAAVDDEHLRMLLEVGMRSALVVPMKVRGRTIGALTLVSAESGRRFDEGDVEFAGQIADRAALAVESSRLYTERSHIASTLQQTLLPPSLPEVPGWEVAALYRPAGPESDVGGDFYDLWQIGEDWLMMIGDVTGKGVEAAALTSLVRHTAWEASESSSQPTRVLARVDAALKRRGGHLAVCTTLCMRLRGARCTIAVGGHPLPLHMRGKEVGRVGRHGSMLGALSEVRWPEAEIEMQAGDTLVATTDGVTDAVAPDGKRFGGERLRGTLLEGAGEAPERLRERLARSLSSFQAAVQADDMAMMIMRFRGEPGRAEAERGRGRARVGA